MITYFCLLDYKFQRIGHSPFSKPHFPEPHPLARGPWDAFLHPFLPAIQNRNQNSVERNYFYRVEPAFFTGRECHPEMEMEVLCRERCAYRNEASPPFAGLLPVLHIYGIHPIPLAVRPCHHCRRSLALGRTFHCIRSARIDIRQLERKASGRHTLCAER